MKNLKQEYRGERIFLISNPASHENQKLLHSSFYKSISLRLQPAGSKIYAEQLRAIPPCLPFLSCQRMDE